MKFAHLFDEVFGDTSSTKPNLTKNSGESGEAVRREPNLLNNNETHLTSSTKISHQSHHAPVRAVRRVVREEVVEIEREIEISHHLTGLTAKNNLGETASADAFDERAAIVEADGGLTRDQAEDQAARDQGFDTAAELRFAVVAGWLRQVNEWGSDHAGDPFRQRLLSDARSFCASEWAIQALHLGWCELDLFAVHGDAPEQRFDSRGLVASLDGRPIAAMTSDTASIRCPAGHCVTYYRRPIDPQRGAVLLWELRV
ncbi:MAG: hypothetical protein RIC87_12485 [Kiloniellales bacterium]